MTDATYLQFHLVWLLPALLLAGAWGLGSTRRLGQRGWLALLATPAIALVYTTPWDNYLVARAVWGYPPDRVLARIGWVPVEEYLFFVLQPLLAGFVALGVLVRWRSRLPAEVPFASTPLRWGALVGALLIATGAVALTRPQGLYLGLILVWAVPILTGMWLYRGAMIWTMRAPALVSITVSTLYLCIADRWAIAQGIWWISEQHSTGALVWGLPIEEALFFLVTNVLVVFAVILFAGPALLDYDGTGKDTSKGSLQSH